MSKQEDWFVTITSELRQNLEESSRAAYENGCSLIKDATILFEAGRFPRAAALAILAEEEFSKSFILLNCTIQNRWDSDIYKAIYKHGAKQAFSEIMKDVLDLFIVYNKRNAEINESKLIPIPFSKYPPKEEIEAAIRKGKARIKKPIKDFFKQDCFFVRCDKKAKIECTPDMVEQNKVNLCLEDADAFKKIAEYQYDEYTKAKMTLYHYS